MTPQQYFPPPFDHVAERPAAAPDEQHGQRDYHPSVKIGADLATISDRGTAADVVSLAVAEQLRKEGIVDAIYPPPRAMMIQFGISSAQSQVVGAIHGAGLIEALFVVSDELPTVFD